jgi:hypothetical protein
VITARAIGVLEEIALNPNHGAAIGLSKTLGEGRDAIQSAITELRELGYVETVSYGRGLKILKITDTGSQFLENRTSLLQYVLNSNINIYANLAIKQTESTREPSEDFTNVIQIGRTVDFYEEDMIEERRKDQIRKHKEKVEMKQKRHEDQRMQRRDPNNTSAWSPTDIGFEFAERVFNLMHIKPWQVTRSRFIYALADKRKEYGTTGDIEKVMIDLYFMQISHDKSLTDPEIVWKRFILQFGNLLVEAKRTMVTPDEIETIKEESQSGREWLRNV